MGRHGLGRLTENGKMFLDTCRTNNLVIGGTLFPHPRVHKITWVSPDSRTENQIDHITISRKWRGSLLDVRNKCGADIASDHHLLVATVRVKITAIKTNNSVSQRRFNVAKLKNPEIANLFTNELVEYGSSNSETRTWPHVRQIFTKAAEKHLGFKTATRKEWISDATWNLIQQRKVAKSAVNTSKTRLNKASQQQLYNRLNSEVKSSARRDKRNWINNIAKELHAAAETHRVRDMYMSVNKLTNRKLSTGKPLKNDEGELITSKTQQVTLWESFYSGMLSTPTAQCQPICGCASHTSNADISTDCPGISEISDSIRSLKPNKSPGLDNISPELLTADRTTSARLLEPIIRSFWAHESLPDELSDGVIINLPKKGDLTNRKNWRGITLLSMVNKVIANILNRRLSTTISPSLRNEKAGFRSGKSCVDQVNSLRIIVEQSVEWRSPLYLIFIDFEKAFDTLSHNAIWNSLVCKGVPEKLIRLIKALYKNATCRVLHGGQLSNKITVKTGVRQGCVLSPLLFNCVLDAVMKRATGHHKRGIMWGLQGRLEDLDYADDICLLSHSFSEMQSKISTISDIAKLVGLKINIPKTKSLRINSNTDRHFFVCDQDIEDVKSFCYLGSTIDTTGGSAADISSRINKARSAFAQLNPVWKSSNISKQTKIKLFNSNIKSTLLYGCETWNMAPRDIQCLQVFLNKCLRKILRIFWPVTISNNQLWIEANQQPIRTEISKRKWSWIGHTLRKSDDDIAKKCLDWNPQGSRRVGRPAHTWKRQLTTELSRLRMKWNEVKHRAEDRDYWNHLVMALCSLEE